MKKDGSERELIARDVWQYTLGDWGGRRVWYKGFILTLEKIGNMKRNIIITAFFILCTWVAGV